MSIEAGSTHHWPLMDGERLIWSGAPQTGWLLTANDAFLIPFSLLWGGFAIFWEVTVLQSKAPFFFDLWGIPFVLIGLYLIVGRFALDAWQRRNTRYALTTHRILINRTGPWPSFTALSLDRLPEVQLSERASGRGTLRFGSPVANSGWNGRGLSFPPMLDSTPQFVAIENAREVFDQIQQAIRSV